MTPTTDMYTLLRAFVDELTRCGMRAACTSPGSRSAPLVLSLAREPRLRCYSHIDERCAGFFALGLAKASGLPVAVACTSGTAAAELLAAAIEAREARVPLLLLTADRPAELRENGAGQAIDQLKLYGSAAKWFFEVDVHEAGAEQLRWMRTLACRAYWTALEGRPGAVHLNFPLREPLVSEDELPEDTSARRDGAPYCASLAADACGRGARPAAAFAGRRRRARRADRGTPRARNAARRSRRASSRASRAGRCWPTRCPVRVAAGRRSRTTTRCCATRALPRRWCRISCCAWVTCRCRSRCGRGWQGSARSASSPLDPEAAWQDPASVLSDSLALEPATALAQLSGSLADGSRRDERASVDEDWLASWRSADERAAEAIVGVLAGERLSEPRVAAELGVLLPAEATLFVASSMPVRDIETFWPVRARPAARALQPRRQRHRRHRLLGVRRGRRLGRAPSSR